MITNQVLGSVLLGVNEQVNCSDCVSAFGSVGSFMAGIHGRKELNCASNDWRLAISDGVMFWKMNTPASWPFRK